MSVFTEHLKATGLPEAATASAGKKLEVALQLTLDQNARIASVKAAKKTDPNDPDFLDSLWKNEAAKGNEKVKAKADEFYEVAERYEKLLAELRGAAKDNFIPAQLSEDEIEKTRKLISQSVAAIEDARKEAAVAAEIMDSMLNVQDKGIEGGLISLLPPLESLRSVGRATRKSGDGKTYITRAADIHVDGKSTNREVNGEIKGHFAYAADRLSKLRGIDIHPNNEVTPDELEDAYLTACGFPTGEEGRIASKGKLPDVREFTFTKKKFLDAEGTKETEVTHRVKVFRKVLETKPETEKPAESKPAESVAQNSGSAKPGPATQKLIDEKAKQEAAKQQPAKK